MPIHAHKSELQSNINYPFLALTEIIKEAKESLDTLNVTNDADRFRLENTFFLLSDFLDEQERCGQQFFRLAQNILTKPLIAETKKLQRLTLSKAAFGLPAIAGFFYAASREIGKQPSVFETIDIAAGLVATTFTITQAFKALHIHRRLKITKRQDQEAQIYQVQSVAMIDSLREARAVYDLLRDKLFGKEGPESIAHFFRHTQKVALSVEGRPTLGL